MKEYDAFSFSLGKGAKQVVEGKLSRITSTVDDRKDDQSGVAVVRNDENA